MDNERIWNLIAKKLSGEASPEELMELEKALRIDPDLHYPLQAVHDLWISNPAPPNTQAENAFERHLERLRASGLDYPPDEPAPLPEFVEAKPVRKTFRIAATCCAFGLLFAGIYWMSRPHLPAQPIAEELTKKPSEVVTQNGTRTKLLLPDGTIVWLNAGSRLIYDSAYGNSTREAILTGEAFFDVVRNKEKPFIIHTANINIKVLGTAFNVKSYPGDKTIETSLIRGKIEVSFKDRSLHNVILKPNQKLVVSAEPKSPEDGDKGVNHPMQKPVVAINRLSHFGADSLVTETAWVDNKLVFQDESFIDLAKKMERWYGIRVALDDQALDTLHFTGSFEKENIQQALKALQLLSHFNFTVHSGEAHIQKMD
jgi:ferric-dicitrate binding protein FerR (iron transport regulator)